MFHNTTQGGVVNKKILIHFFVLLLICSTIQQVSSQNQKITNDPSKTQPLSDKETHPYVDNQIIVKFSDTIPSTTIENINKAYGAISLSNNSYSGFHLLQIPTNTTVPDMVKIYTNNRNVEYAEPNYITQLYMYPNDEYYPSQWNFHNKTEGGINVEPAWDITNGSDVIVAVLDSGITPGSDLNDTCFVPGIDIVNDDDDPADDNGHGTHVAGTIAQNTNNSIGVCGIAFNACLMPIKVVNSTGYGTTAQLVNGIYYAIANNADIISISLGGPPSTTEQQAVAAAYNAGITVIAASGNNNGPVRYPAAYNDYVIAVGATRVDTTRAPYSNYGANLDLVAPGGDMSVDQNNDGNPDGILQQTRQNNQWGYYYFEGTSMAAPHVSGVAALICSMGVTSPDDIRFVLESSAFDLGALGVDDYYGHGLLNASNAVLVAQDVLDNPPVAHNDSYTLNEDTILSTPAPGVLGNDTDAEDDLLTAITLTDPSHGVLISFQDNGSFVYQPTSNYYGLDTFTYHSYDGVKYSNEATVRLTILPVNDPPVAQNDTKTVIEDSIDNQINVLLNDNDIENNPLTVISVTQPTHGTSTRNGNIVLYTPQANYYGSDVFSYTISDGQGGTDTATITITITPVNDAPIAQDDTVTIQEDSNTTQINVRANDIDVDGDPITILSVTQPAHGSSSTNGLYAFYTPALNYYGTDFFTYTITDGHSSTDSATVTITVTSRNDPPVANFTYTVNDRTVTFDASSSYDIDGTITTYNWDFGDTTAGTGTLISHTYSDYGSYDVMLTVHDNNGGTGTISKVVDVEDFIPPEITDNTPSAGYTGNAFTFTATITDGDSVTSAQVEYWYGTGAHTNSDLMKSAGDTWSKTITITNTLNPLHYFIIAADPADNWNTTITRTIIIADDDTPTFNDHSPSHGTAGQSYIFDVTASDNIGVATVTVNWTHGITNETDRLLQNDGDGTWSLTISLDDNLTDMTYQLTITDTSDNTQIGPLKTIPIVENQPPTTPQKPSGETYGYADKPYMYQTRSTDPNDDAIYYKWNWSDGTQSDWLGPYPSGQITTTSHHWEKGNYSISVKAKDAYGLESPWSIALTVQMIQNYPPLLSNETPAHQSSKLPISTSTLRVSISDPEGDPINWSITTSPNVGSSSGTNAPNGTKSCSITRLTYSRTYYWNVHVFDGIHWTNTTYRFTTESNPNGGGGGGGGTGGGGEPPELENEKPHANASVDGPYQGYINTAIFFNGSRSYDPDGTITKWNWVFGDNTTGTGETTTHTYRTPGTYQVSLTVTDNKGATHTDITTCRITQPNRPPSKPTINGPTYGTKDTNYEYTVLSTDADDDPLSYSINWDDTSQQTNTSGLIQSDTPVTFHHAWNTPGIYTIMVYSSDNDSASQPTSLTVLIDVKYVNELGYFINQNADGVYDLFYSNSTMKYTVIQKQADGMYLLDTNGDGEWDYTYNPVTSALTTYTPQTPGFELIFIFVAIATLVFLKRKKYPR